MLYHVTNPWDSANPANLMLTLGFKNNCAKRCLRLASCVQNIMTTPPKPPPLAPLPPPPQPPQNITSAIFQPVVQHAPSRPPLSGPPRDPSKLPASCKPQDGPGRQLVWMVISSSQSELTDR